MGEIDISNALGEARRKKWDDRTLAQRAADMAQTLQAESLRHLRSDERTLLSALSRLVADEKNRSFLENLCSRVLNLTDEQLQASNLRALINEFGGVPTFFSTMGRLRLRAASMAARSLQKSSIAEVRRIFRSTFGELVFPGQPDKLDRRLREAAKEGVHSALHPLDPPVFGKKSAAAYARRLASLLQETQAGVVIQPWRLCPGLSPFSPQTGAETLGQALCALLSKTPQGRPVVVETGTSDILPVVIEGVKRALDHKENFKANLILELPAYLKNADVLLRDLTEWATSRAAKGGSALKLMLVKGSHLSEERVIAFTYGPERAAASTKAETETRYKRLIHTAIGTNPAAILPVIATHNIFDLSYALLDWGRSGREGLPPAIFLAGIGNHLGRLLAKAGADVTICSALEPRNEDSTGFETHLLSLVNELSRPDGFLSDGYAPEADSMGWGRMRQHFLAALSGRETQEPPSPNEKDEFNGSKLRHIADRAYVSQFYAAAEAEHERTQDLLPLTINGKNTDSPLTCIHRSLTSPQTPDYRFVCADYAAVYEALTLAAQARHTATPDERRKNLKQAARLLEKRRTELAALLVRDAGFTFEDAEYELGNAIDACLYYEYSSRQDGLLDGTHPSPLGVVVVAAGRAHPLAEAMSGIAAAWVTGNAIVYKPAAYTTMTGLRIASLLKEAGMRPPHFQCLPCLDNEIAFRLMTDSCVDGVIASGAASQARAIAAKAPRHVLCGQPSGTSSVYLSSQGDWHKAIPDIIHAAFRRSGQSPACPHVLLLHASIYDNQAFINALKDAVGSLSAEPGWRESAHLGPLSAPLTKEQLRLLASSGNEEESWLLAPHPQGKADGALLWQPGIRTGLSAGDPFLQQAQQLPLIGLVRVESAAEAIPLQKILSAGQAAAIYSQSEEEVNEWSRGMNVSQLYINCCPSFRPGLQPLGSLHPDAPGVPPLPGGRNFLTTLCQWQENARPQRRGKQRNIPFSPWENLTPKPSPEETMRMTSAADSISYWWENEFGNAHLLCDKPGEKTELRYQPVPVCFRMEAATSDMDLSIALMAALTAGCKTVISLPEQRPWMETVLAPLPVEVKEESREAYEGRFPAMAKEGVWVRDTAATDSTWAAAAASGLRLSSAPVLANGRLELLHYLREQTCTRHTARFGKL